MFASILWSIEHGVGSRRKACQGNSISFEQICGKVYSDYQRTN